MISPFETQPLVALAMAAAIFFLFFIVFWFYHCFLKNLISLTNLRVSTFSKSSVTSF
jgi:hypothetical protein